MFKEATTRGPIQQRAANVLVEGTVGAVSIGFAVLDAGTEALQRQAARNAMLQRTPVLNMMAAQHNRAKQQRQVAADNAKKFLKECLFF